VFNKGILDFK